MNKGLFFLAMLLSLSITLSSCDNKDADASCSDGIRNGNETGVDCGGSDCPSCCVCGVYEGLANGILVVPSQSINDVVFNENMLFNLIQYDDDTYEIQFYFYTPSSIGTPLFNFTFFGELNGNTLSISNDVFSFDSSVCEINGTATFNNTFDEITGNFYFSGGASGSVSIDGEK